jgi:hypothetical protein
MNTWSPIDGITFYLGGENGKARRTSTSSISRVNELVFASVRGVTQSKDLCVVGSALLSGVPRSRNRLNGIGRNMAGWAHIRLPFLSSDDALEEVLACFFSRIPG